MVITLGIVAAVLLIVVLADRSAGGRETETRADEWSPFAGFYSDRSHWRPPER